MNSIAYINANVIPMEDGARHCAVFVKDGRIAMLGTDDQIAAAAKAVGVVPIDAKGATILPGFFDCHVHALTTGMNASGVDLYDCRDIGELVALLKEEEARLSEGQWVFGKRLDESRLKEGRRGNWTP
jgi:predicted amidohydrolase YtcJ